MKHPPNRSDRLVILRIVVIYAFFSGLWIYLSDKVVGFLVRDTASIVRISVFKGLLFIILTSYILYQLIAQYTREFKQADQALRESEERYRQLVEYSPDAILVHDGSEYTFANTAALRLFGAEEPHLYAQEARAWLPVYQWLLRLISSRFLLPHDSNSK